MSPKKQVRKSTKRKAIVLEASNGSSMPPEKRKEDAKQAIYLNRI